MKHHITSLFVVLALLMAGNGCTPGSDIGEWFGTWTVDSYTVDGAAQDLDPQGRQTTYYLQFQHSVVCLRHTDALHDQGESYGNWNENHDAGAVTIKFDPLNYDVRIMPLEADYTIARSDNRHITLSTTDADGHQRRYELSKL